MQLRSMFKLTAHHFRHGGVRRVMQRALVYAGRINGLEWAGELMQDPDPSHAPSYRRWIAKYDSLTEQDRFSIRKRVRAFRDPPRFCVLLQVGHAPIEAVHGVVTSLQSQIYPHWTLRIAGAGTAGAYVTKYVEKAASTDPRIHPLPQNGEAVTLRSCLAPSEQSLSNVVALLRPGDRLREHALYLVAEELLRNPLTDLLYGDEDQFDATGRRCNPYFKPDWNPDLFYCSNYLGHFLVLPAARLRALPEEMLSLPSWSDWKLLLRVVESADELRIRHIPHVLIHQTGGESRDKSPEHNAEFLAQRQALQAHFERRRISVHMPRSLVPGCHRVAFDLPQPPPLVSVIMPTQGRAKLLHPAVEGILQRTDYPQLELILVTNNMLPQDLPGLEPVVRDARVKVVSFPDAFNFSAINNLGARHARGDVLVFMNDDVHVQDPHWLREMTSHALRAEIGVVGCKLLFPDGRIQHAGVILGMGGVAGLLHQGKPGDWPGRMGRRALLNQNLSAVTAACCAVRRGVFQAVGGMDEQLAVAFNDVDFCLRVREHGYRNLFTPDARLVHAQGASRGRDDSPQKQNVYWREVRLMQSRWGSALLDDPYYNPNLSLASEQELLAVPPRAPKPWRE